MGDSSRSPVGLVVVSERGAKITSLAIWVLEQGCLTR